MKVANIALPVICVLTNARVDAKAQTTAVHFRTQLNTTKIIIQVFINNLVKLDSYENHCGKTALILSIEKGLVITPSNPF